jgi:hypothetical protein
MGVAMSLGLSRFVPNADIPDMPPTESSEADEIDSSLLYPSTALAGTE